MINNVVRGVIDGALSTLGVLIGASAGNPSIILSAGLGGTIANGISNVVGAFSAEKAREHEQLRGLEKAMVHKDLKDSVLDDRIDSEVRKAGLVDGISTLLGGFVPIAPYLVLPPGEAMLLAIGLVLFILVILGVYLGKISKENIVLSSMKMVIMGVAVALIAYFIQNALAPAGV